MATVIPYEELARQILSRVLRTEVTLHDDGSEPSMYDLAVLGRDGPSAAVEVTSATDGEALALWRIMNEKEGRWQVEGLAGGWSAALHPWARGKRVWKELPSLLAVMEQGGITDLRHANDPLVEEIADELGVADLVQLGTESPGRIYVTLSLPSERTGGGVPETGTPLSKWIGEYLRGPDRADVLRKLASSLLPERHAVVVVPPLSEALFPVVDLLIRDDAPTPSEDPDLPSEVTSVWVFSTWTTGRGFRWSRDGGWLPFEKFSAEKNV